MPAFYVENFGCRATQADGAAIERELLQKGLLRAANIDEAEVVVLNTCTVTAAADQDARAAIRRAHRNHPEVKILVTGCYAQRAPQELATLPGVTWVLGNSHKHQAAQVVAEGLQAQEAGSMNFESEKFESKGGEPKDGELNDGELNDGELKARHSPDRHSPDRKSPEYKSQDFKSPDYKSQGSFIPLEALSASEGARSKPALLWVGDIFAHTQLLAAPVFELAGESPGRYAAEQGAGTRIRPNLKVQDGCNNRCSFCIIPYTRGRSRSLPIQRVLQEVDQLIEAGYRELVLTGINLGRWGRDFDRPERFEGLLRAILEETTVEKLRISSVEPMDWSDELIGMISSSPRIAKHAHVPLQSGCDATLRAMHRRYRPWHYAEKIRGIREALPSAAIGADVMVGFPGESEAQFEESRRFIEHLPFTYLHVFTFSSRPGTPAAEMADQVPAAVARERSRILRELAAQKNRAFRESLVGTTISVITLGASDHEFTEALSDNFIKVRVRGAHRSNQWLSPTVQGLSTDGLIASCGT